MGVEDDNCRDRIGRDAISEEVGDEDAGGDEEGLAGGVEGRAVVYGEVGREVGGGEIRVRVL